VTTARFRYRPAGRLPAACTFERTEPVIASLFDLLLDTEPRSPSSITTSTCSPPLTTSSTRGTGPLVVGTGLALLTLAPTGPSYVLYVRPAVVVFGLGLGLGAL
jgi:hypothetical protein